MRVVCVCVCVHVCLCVCVYVCVCVCRECLILGYVGYVCVCERVRVCGVRLCVSVYTLAPSSANTRLGTPNVNKSVDSDMTS